MSISIGGGSGGGAANLSTAVLANYVYTGPPTAQTVAPGGSLRLDPSGSIIERITVDPVAGAYLEFQNDGVYDLSVRIAPNSSNLSMLTQVLVDGLPLPGAHPPTLQWIYTVIRVTAGQRLTIVNADAGPYLLDTGANTVYVDLKQRT